jgi:outer membrane protein assembly factor BamE (lipoprotein component of BamABCDE complex)
MRMRNTVFLIAAAVAVAGFSCPGWDEGTARKKIEAGLQQVKVGMSPSQVKEILGPPTFEENPVSELFRSSNEDCRGRTASAFVYQFSREPSLIVYFDGDERVACVEEAMAFRVVRT